MLKNAHTVSAEVLTRPAGEAQFIKLPASISDLTLWVLISHITRCGLVPVGLSVNGQRIRFAQINDGSESSVSGEVMGTDAGRLEDRERVTDR